MVYVLVPCPGAEWAEGIAELANRVRSVSGYAWLYPVVTGRKVAEVWLRSSCEEYRAVVAVTTSGRVVGAAWAWPVDGGVAGRVWAIVDPLLPLGERLGVLGQLLSWARWVLEQVVHHTGVVGIRLGERYGFMHRLVSAVLGEGIVRETGFLMVYRGGALRAPEPRLPVAVRVVEPHVDKTTLSWIVEIFNDAFSVYPDHRPWRIEDAERYYRVLYTSPDRKPVVLMAFHEETGEPIGFAEAYTHRTISGTTAGYVALLAVKRRQQGRGVGGLLLAKATNTLRGMGAQVVYLDAKPGPHRLYERMGYQVEASYIEATWSLADLPGTPPAARSLISGSR